MRFVNQFNAVDWMITASLCVRPESLVFHMDVDPDIGDALPAMNAAQYRREVINLILGAVEDQCRGGGEGP